MDEFSQTLSRFLALYDRLKHDIMRDADIEFTQEMRLRVEEVCIDQEEKKNRITIILLPLIRSLFLLSMVYSPLLTGDMYFMKFSFMGYSFCNYNFGLIK
jgi:hypothetical protein